MTDESAGPSMAKPRTGLLALAFAGWAVLGTGLAPGAEPVPGTSAVIVEADGTQLVATFSDGRVMRSADLVGAVLGLRSGLRVRIDAVEEARDAQGNAMWLHTFTAQQGDGTWANICGVGPDGRRTGFPVPGRAAPDGVVAEAEHGVFELTCAGGAQAKCVNFGYGPWARGPDGRPMRPLYNACIRMVRADYGGDGTATTRNGTMIDLWDLWEVQTPDLLSDQEFEAGWGPDGAVCVRHPRIKENISLAELERRHPHLRGRTGAVCTEAFARAHGAVLFNRSAP